MKKPRPTVIGHAWLMERDYDDPHRGRVVALGPQGADLNLVRRLLEGEGFPFTLRDQGGYPVYDGRYLHDPESDSDGPFSEAPLIEYGLHLGATRITYSTPEDRA